LHGEAQHEFVDYIYNELGSAQQTIYTTHSQHMVDPARYEKLRAVHDRATRESPELGVVVTPPNLSADPATILPIESALGYSVSRHLFIGSGQHLVVEGSSDFVYIQRLTEHLSSIARLGLDPRLAIIPVGGADNMPAFVALLGRRLKVSALVDGARTGPRLSRIKAAARSNSVPESAVIAVSQAVEGIPTNSDIEDLFAAADYLRLYNWAFGTNVEPDDLPNTGEPIVVKLNQYRGSEFDHALPAHKLTERREEFFNSADPQTLDRFEGLFSALNATIH
jgi:predicted ATP-dependent endonuclease of OLD family